MPRVSVVRGSVMDHLERLARIERELGKETNVVIVVVHKDVKNPKT